MTSLWGDWRTWRTEVVHFLFLQHDQFCEASVTDGTKYLQWGERSMRRFKHVQKTIPEFNGTGEMSDFVTLAS